MFRLLLILVLWGTNAYSQSIGISPNSYHIVGQMEGISEVFVEYKFAGLHYFHKWNPQRYVFEDSDKIVEDTSSLAVSVIPVDLTYFRTGVMVFHRRFPVTESSRVHFVLEASLPIRRFTISFKHISNGFGMFNDVNPGVDTFSLKYRL